MPEKNSFFVDRARKNDWGVTSFSQEWYNIGMEKERETDKNSAGYSRGVKAGVFGMISNALLFVAKLTVGALIGSIAVVADAFNNLSDGANSVITVVGYKLSARPADREHPFGHARFEYVAALVVSVVMFMLGALFLKESVTEIFSAHDKASIGAYVYVVLGLSVLVKGGQAVVYGTSYRKTRSLPMKAAATDACGDMAVTTGAILSTVILHVTGKDLDGYFGAAISLFILVSAIRLMKEGVSPLLGTAPSEALVGTLKGKVASYDGVLGVHDVLIHSYGVSRVYAVLHVEVNAAMSLTEAHELADAIERDVSRELNVHLVVHIDPREQAAGAAAQAARLSAFLSERFSGVSLHDFRLTEDGGKRCAYFDVEIPYESDLTAERITEALRAFDPDCDFVVNLDRK